MVRREPSLPKIYFDENLLQIAQNLAREYSNISHLGYGDFPIVRGTPDEEWLSLVGPLGWIAFVLDRRIIKERSELEALLNSGARVVMLGSAMQWTTDRIFRMVRWIWTRLPDLATKPGPWVYYVIEDNDGRPDPDLLTKQELLERLAEMQRRQDRSNRRRRR